MTLDSLQTLGRSGLVTSSLALGTMTFGTKRWGAEAATSRAIFDAYLDAGGNFIDTADIYAGGRSEELLGDFIADAHVRHDIVLATKFGFNDSTSPLDASSTTRTRPLRGGAGAKNIHRALEGSLKRLQTDHIDLYWMHIWDGVTPVEEIVQTLSDLVRAGKIRYYAFSDIPAWVATKAATIATERGLPGPIAMQVEYSLVARDTEREHFPAASDAAMGMVPWSPLAGGFLTGKYPRDKTASKGRLSGANPFGDTKFTQENWDILDVVQAVAKEQERTCAQVALAWVMSRPGVTSTLVGASRPEQLHDNLAAAQIALTADQHERLDTASRPAPGFGDMLTSAPIRAMLFGGRTVKRWSEQRGA